MKTHQWLALLCSSFCLAAQAQTVIDNFEYASDDDLAAAWIPSANATVSLSDSVAAHSTGKKSLRIDFNFPSVAWTTETVRGPSLDSPIAISPSQYLSVRIHGDTAFAKADFRTFYLYAYDADGNFGRWGTPVPITDDWQLYNFAASAIEQPWDAPALPDLSRIVQFAIFQYGSETAIDAYTATVYVDDIMVRDTPLTEFPAPAATRALIDNFEGYANDTALLAFYTYENSPAATATSVSLQTAAPEGSKALKLAIDFAPGQWPWGSVRSAMVAPFSFPTNGVLTLRLKGDPTLAAMADGGTTFWLSFYDKAGGRITYNTPAAPVISSDWTTLQATFADFGDTSTVDIGNLVQWRILVEGWQGAAESTAMSGTFYVDDIRITTESATQPSLAIASAGNGLTITMTQLVSGKSYDLRTSPDLVQWTSATVINATGSTMTWPVTPSQARAFFKLVEKTAL